MSLENADALLVPEEEEAPIVHQGTEEDPVVLVVSKTEDPPATEKDGPSAQVETEEVVATSTILEEEEEKKDEEPEQADLATPTGNSPVKLLLQEHVPGVLADEELGLIAMFQEIHQSMPEAPGKELARATMAQIFAVWTEVQKKSKELAEQAAATKKQEETTSESPRSTSAAVPLAKEDISMAAMFREISDNLPGDAASSMDAILANMLHSVSQVPELVSPSVTTKAVREDEDLSLTGMFKEIASLFPGGNVSEQQVEKHIVGRVEQIITASE